MATTIRENRNPARENNESGTYRGQRSSRDRIEGLNNSPARPRDVTLMDIKRLEAGVTNLLTDIGDLFTKQVDIPGTRSDVINEFGVLDIKDGDSEFQKRDSIQLFFDDITNTRRIQFRATIASLSEVHSPSWVQHDYIGRPYPIHQYKGVTRELSFDFKVYAMNKAELEFIWQKLNYLTGMTHPASYTATDEGIGFMTPPYIELTVGNLYNKIPGFINALTYTIADGTSWDISKQMPFGVDINVGYTIIETGSESNAKNPAKGKGSKFYASVNNGGDVSKHFSGVRGAWNNLADSFSGFIGNK